MFFGTSLTSVNGFGRSEYEKLKAKCKEMEKTVGTGKIITAAIISEDGQPIEDPSSMTSNEADPQVEKKTDNINLDKEVIQWKLTLHQIGKTAMIFIICYLEKHTNLKQLKIL